MWVRKLLARFTMRLNVPYSPFESFQVNLDFCPCLCKLQYLQLWALLISDNKRLKETKNVNLISLAVALLAVIV